MYATLGQKNLKASGNKHYIGENNLGMKELEIIIGDWIDLNIKKMDYKDLDQFEEEVIQVENPVLFQYLCDGKPLNDDNVIKDGKKHTESRYLLELKEYVEKRKNNFGKYVEPI